MEKTARRLFWSWILLVFFPVFQSYAADQPTKEIVWAGKLFDNSQGLSEEHVYQVFEDKDGFLWVLTERDLQFFDGTSFFVVLNHQSAETFRNIRILCQDAGGRVWVRYVENGKVVMRVFDGQSRILLTAEDFFPKGLSSDEIRSVTTRLNGDFFLLTLSGDIWRQSADSGEWTIVTKCISPEIDFAYVQNKEGIWLVSRLLPEENYLTLGYWKEEETAVRFFHIPNLVHFRSGVGEQLVLVTKTKLGFLHPDKQLQWHAIESYFPDFDPKVEEIRGYNSKFGYNPINGDAFLIHRNHLELVNLSSGKPYLLRKKPFLQSQFTAIFDRDNNIWVGTLEGLQQFEYGVNPFERIMWLDPSENQFFHQFSSRGISVCPDGDIFFSANENIFVYDREEGEVRRLFYTNNGTSDIIWDNKNKRIWTFGDYFYAYDPEGNDLSQYVIPRSFEEGYTFGLYSMGDSVLVSSSNGMWIFLVKQAKFVPFLGYGDFPELATAEVYGFFKYSEKEILLYGNKGMYLWEKGGEIKGHYSVLSKGKYHIPTTNVRHVHKDAAGVFWLATAEGLIRWEPELLSTRRYTTSNGLYDSNLYGIFEDRHGFLWLSTNKGIIQFHKASGISRHFGEEDGISNNEFNRVSHEQDSAGNIYFGSLNGITKFHPDDFVFDPLGLAPKPVKVTRLSVFSRDQNGSYSKMAEYLAERRIRIKPSELNLEATFAVSDFDIGGGASYAYRLSGSLKSDSWIPMQSPDLQVPGLPYGKYDLEIRVRDKNQEFGDSYLVIPLEVIPPLYLRKGFILVMTLLFWTLLVWGGTRELRRRDEQNALLQKRVAESTATIAADKELIEAQAKSLELKNLEKDRFFANISHEFRTPISLILGPAELLLRQYKNNSKASLLLNTVKKNAQQLLKLVNDILLLSKLDYAQIKVNPRTFAIKPFLDTLVLDFDDLLESKKIILTKNYRFKPEQFIRQDERILTIVLQNLLSNAYKYTPSGGKVLLKVIEASNVLIIEVKDNGRGIRKEDLPYIFDRYFQSDQKWARLEGGTGIGLALVKEVLTLVGGDIAVESEWRKGSTFKVKIPLLAAENEETKNEPNVPISLKNFVSEEFSTEEWASLQGKSILLVEDNPDFYGFMRLLFGEYFVVQTAANGALAMDILRRQEIKPLLIITDLMMPEMDGFELLSKISTDNALKKIPTLVLTARVEDESRLKALNLGASDYIIKPFDSQVLLHTVVHLVRRYLVQIQAELETAQGEVFETEMDAWVLELKEIVEQNLAAEDFSVDQLATRMLMGRTTFYNQVRKSTGMTPNQLILEARLQRARKLLLENSRLTVREVVKAVGFKHEPHFIDIFQKRFGYTPGQINK